MWAVVALISACAVAAAVAVPLSTEHPAPRESPWDLAENARKMVAIAGGLAAFAITAVVLLLSFAQQPGDIGTPLSSAVGMFLVAFMSLIASALMYANQTRAGVVESGVEIQTLQYSLTTMMFFRSIFLAWLGLRPLVEAYGLEALADQLGWLLLVVSVLAGWTLSVAVLYRLSIVGARVVVLVPLLALAACGAVAVAFELWPDARSDASSLYLSYALFALNVVSFVVYAVVPGVLEHERLGRAIAGWWGTGMAVLAVVSATTIGFIWLATAGLV